jgi:membrane protein implicated in regulation of membrane protease activity
VLPGRHGSLGAASLSIVAGSSFLWLLATLTAATGMALVVMLWRRARQRRLEAEIRGASQRTVVGLSAPAELGGEEEMLDDVDLEDDETWGKICPACHSRYGHHVSTCSRDDSELAALN